jgi:hypothetical protein
MSDTIRKGPVAVAGVYVCATFNLISLSISLFLVLFSFNIEACVLPQGWKWTWWKTKIYYICHYPKYAAEAPKFPHSRFVISVKFMWCNLISYLSGQSQRYQNNIIQILLYTYSSKWPDSTNPTVAASADSLNICQQTYCKMMIEYAYRDSLLLSLTWPRLIENRIENCNMENYRSLFTEKNADGWNVLHFLLLPHFKYPISRESFSPGMRFSALLFFFH